MTIKRRDFLKGMAAAGVGAVAMGTGLTVLDPESALSQPRSNSKEFSGETLTVFTETGPTIAGPVAMSVEGFKKLTGANVNLITAPFSDLYTKTMADFVTGGSEYDVILNPSSWLGDYAPYIVDLTSMIQHDASLDWSDVIYKKNATYGGRLLAMPMDGDNQLQYWRRDIIGNKSIGAAFQKEFGKPLAPPATWDDFIDIARFFADGKYGVYGAGLAYQHGGQAFWYYMSCCVAYCTAPGEKGGLFFDPTNLKPLINDAGHLQGLENYAELVKYGPPGMINFDDNDIRQGFASGSTVLAIDWDDAAIIGELQKGSKIRGKIGSALLPGTSRVWNYRTEKWETTPTLNRPAWLAFGGWQGTIPKTTHNVALAYKYLSYQASPAFSLKMVTTPNTGMNPWRYSQFRNVAAWEKVGYPQPDLGIYLKAMETSDLSPSAVQDMRLPGAADFQDATEVGTSQAVAGEVKPQAALDGIARSGT